MHENEIGTAVVDFAFHLQQDLSPGLLQMVVAGDHRKVSGNGISPIDNRKRS